MKDLKPYILINILTHGDELIGLEVKKELEKTKIKKGVLEFQIANEKAYLNKKRFIDSDLNRVFPGKKNGNYEEKLAYNLLPKINKADIVIDIHSTTSELKDALIITKFNKKVKKIVEIVNPKYVLVMNLNKTNALISNAKVGIAFEYGKDKDKKVIKKTTKDIKKILSHFEMIDCFNTKEIKNKSKIFYVNKIFPKLKGQKLNSNIKNYKLVKKNQIVAFDKNTQIKSKEDFYPILFGEKNYEDIFGFIGKIL